MTREPDSQRALQYALPRLRAPRPAHWGRVGCGSSVLGAIAFGPALPWMMLRGFVYDDPPALLIWGLNVLAGAVIGAIVGALVVPAMILCVYWILWRIAGRP